MTAPPSNTTVSLMPDADAYLMGTSLHITSAGGAVSFQPPADMPASQRAAIAARVIAIAERWRDAALAEDSRILQLADLATQREAGDES